ncbi:hypothetical protein HORIV_56510 [Vreelandella olivaria]|uniref:Uncharacterized protein n=1 Tax=Vreelandella olivaria TaxID=390919 RepID=A0ABM7GR77_9GAMM|nr:hypothetical protein HORIV_56510 [Halomonas olivaria]
MNAAEFHAEQLKVLHAIKVGEIDPNAIITGMVLEDGSYHILSRIGDDVWTLPDSLFSAGIVDSMKMINFLHVPVAFRETLRGCIARYILSGIEGRSLPKGGTIRGFFNLATLFLSWLHEQHITRLSDVTPLIGQQYVDFCKGLKSQK